MGKSQRDKGRRGESAAKLLLSDRDYTILADTSAGISTDDLVVQSPCGQIVSVEVKNTKLIDLPRFVAQARKNAKKNRWMLLAKLDNTSSWLCLKQGEKPQIWHQKGEE